MDKKKCARLHYLPRFDELYTTDNPIKIRITGQRLSILAHEYVLSRSELSPIRMMIAPKIIGPVDLFLPPQHSSSTSQLRLLILLPNRSARSPNSSARSSISSSQFLPSRRGAFKGSPQLLQSDASSKFSVPHLAQNNNKHDYYYNQGYRKFTVDGRRLSSSLHPIGYNE